MAPCDLIARRAVASCALRSWASGPRKLFGADCVIVSDPKASTGMIPRLLTSSELIAAGSALVARSSGPTAAGAALTPRVSTCWYAGASVSLIACTPPRWPEYCSDPPWPETMCDGTPTGALRFFATTPAVTPSPIVATTAHTATRLLEIPDPRTVDLASNLCFSSRFYSAEAVERRLGIRGYAP